MSRYPATSYSIQHTDTDDTYSDASSTPSPPAHRYSLSFSLALPFQLPGFSFWPPPAAPTPMRKIPQLVLIPPTPERPVITTSRTENKRLTERFFQPSSIGPTRSSPPRNLSPVPYARTRPHGSENKENVASKRRSQQTSSGSPPGLRRSGTGTLPRHVGHHSRPISDPANLSPLTARSTFRPSAPSHPPGLGPAATRYAPTSPTPVRRRPALQSPAPNGPSSPLAPTFRFPTANVPARAPTYQASTYPRADAGNAVAGGNANVKSRVRFALEVEDEEDASEHLRMPLLGFSSAPQRQLTPQRVRAQQAHSYHTLPLQQATRPASAGSGTESASQHRRAGSLALAERTNVSARVFRHVRGQSADLDKAKLKKIWDDWDLRETGTQKKQADKSVFVIGEWDDDDEVWDDCTL